MTLAMFSCRFQISSYCEDGRVDFRALYMSELKVEVFLTNVHGLLFFNFSSWKFENTFKNREKSMMPPLSFLKSFGALAHQPIPKPVPCGHVLRFVMAAPQRTNQAYIYIIVK